MNGLFKLTYQVARYSFASGVAITLLLTGCGGGSSPPAPGVLKSITISPNPVFIGIGTTLSLAATGNYSNGNTADLTSQVKWTSASPTIASLGATGLLTAISATPGDWTTVTAALNGITSPAVTVTLTTAKSIASIDLNIPRYDHTATELLAGSGVLVTGGFGLNSKALPSAELYIAASGVSGTWVPAGNMTYARRDHTATLLANGKVLLIGGGGDPGVNDLASAELFDPATNTWALSTSLSSLQSPRSYHTATLITAGINAGKILVVGGTNTISSNELYDPAVPATVATNVAPDISATGRYSHTATLLQDGITVLIVGGFDGTTAISKAEFCNTSMAAASMTMTQAGSPAQARYLHSATLLPGGKVLVAGGINASGQYLASAELYTQSTNSWSPAASMSIARAGQTATLMPNGKVLVMGGFNATDPALSSAELYDPNTNTWRPTANLQVGRDVHTATLLTTGPYASSVLVTGGIGATNNILSSVELHN